MKTRTLSEYKQQAAEFAVRFVRSGMVVGLGHGSTAVHAIRKIGTLIAAGELTDIIAVPCSKQVEVEAGRLGIPLAALDDHPVIDVTIDGADEVTDTCDVIKGGGGALLRGKMVAQASRREIIVVDESKVSPRLGTQWPVPVEVLPLWWRSHLAYFKSLGARPILRTKGQGGSFITDQSNFIIDCHFGPIRLAQDICARAGVIEHGLFLDLVTDVVIAGAGGIRHVTRDTPSSKAEKT
jgi:ribose 5-phosphate isomerase A